MKTENINKLLKKVKQLLSPCILCERRCGVDRINGEKGFCGLGAESYVFKDFIRVGEEADLSPTHAIYFTGCNMRCLYCSNEEHSKINPIMETPVDCKKLAERIDELSVISKNVNFIGGEPTVNLFNIVRIISEMKSDLPVAWNSNMYASIEAMEIIDSFTDIYLADFKFWDNKCSKKIASTENYCETVSRNLLFINPEKQIIIRHLPLPGHKKCCSEPIIDWMSKNLQSAALSIITAMVPTREFPKGVSEKERQELIEYAAEKGITHVIPSSVPDEFHEENDSDDMILTNIIIQPDGSVIFQDMNRKMADVAKRIE